MKTVERAKIDLPSFVHTQRRERFPSFLIHGTPLSGKTIFASTLAKQLGAVYIDVLAAVAGDPEHSSHIDQFDAATLKKLLLQNPAITGADLVLVDDFDFLLHTWAGDLTPFMEMVARLVSPGKPAVFGFFAQTRPVFESWNLLTARREQRVIRFEDIKPL